MTEPPSEPPTERPAEAPTEPLMPYDEFALFHENIDEFDLAVAELPPVERVSTALDDGRSVSALKWGRDEPEIVMLHGGAQNAHTWDTVVLALGRPVLAVDLPGHGHSDWREDGAYTPRNLADDVMTAITADTTRPVAVVGMSLGGLTAMELAVRHPEVCRSLVMVDITPGVNQEKAKAVLDFVDGPQSFERFEDLLARTMEFNPTRSESSLRRGILHNARQESDGSWRWRYDRSGHGRTRDEVAPAEADHVSPTASLWDDFGAVGQPLMLVRGSTSPVVDDEDVAEARRRQPSLELHVVDGAGHSVQGDRPVELASLLEDWLVRS